MAVGGIPKGEDWFPEDAGGLWRWVFFSGFLHAALIVAIFLMPYAPQPRLRSYPVYTVDLVGGERIGGAEPSFVPRPAKETQARQSQKKAQIEIQKAKEEKKAKVGEKARIKIEEKPELPEKVTAKKPPGEAEAAGKPAREGMALKKEEGAPRKQEPEKAQGLPDRVRERLIQGAIERVRGRAEKSREAEQSPGPSTGPGAAALGPGGAGGGIPRGLEFVRYFNLMRSLIKARWTWVGKKTDLEVTVRFSILENGEIAGLKIVRRSGDASYDASVVRAVTNASPLPPPPPEVRKDFADVELTFRPKDLSS